jgi:microsomal dipeptidase-like Zn-dependent dipeptidase
LGGPGSLPGRGHSRRADRNKHVEAEGGEFLGAPPKLFGRAVRNTRNQFKRSAGRSCRREPLTDGGKPQRLDNGGKPRMQKSNPRRRDLTASGEGRANETGNDSPPLHRSTSLPCRRRRLRHNEPARTRTLFGHKRPVSGRERPPRYLPTAESHSDKMGIALSVADARAIIASDRMAVFMGCESGFDHEGDLNILGAMYRLVLRSVQFATQSGFNAFSDSALAPVQGGQPTDHYRGINDRGRALVAEMNRLGILIDITHGTEAVHMQLIEASRAPVVASHDSLKAVSGIGLSDEVLKALARKGGLVGIHGGATAVGKQYRRWMAEKPENAANAGNAVLGKVGYQPQFTRPPGDRGEFIARMDEESAKRWRTLGSWKEIAEAQAALPTPEEWAD